jgi:uncharacterized protein YodC (DUF2158 family)
MQQLKRGDLVTHRTCNLEMVVTEFANGKYHCRWYDDTTKNYKGEYFAECELEKIEEQDV